MKRYGFRQMMGLLTLVALLLVRVLWYDNYYTCSQERKFGEVKNEVYESLKMVKNAWTESTELSWLEELHDVVQRKLKGRSKEVAQALLIWALEDVEEFCLAIKPGNYLSTLMYIVNRHESHAARKIRAELLSYLELDEQGKLKIGYPQRKERATAAHFILRNMDRHLDSPEHWPTWDTLSHLSQELLWDKYRPILKEHGERPPAMLVEYLFHEFDAQAWELFARLELGPQANIHQLTPRTHLIETTAWRMENSHKNHAEMQLAGRAIAQLVRHDKWYTRRYAVHILLKYPFFRAPELVKKLQEDPHPLVRERAKYLNPEVEVQN